MTYVIKLKFCFSTVLKAFESFGIVTTVWHLYLLHKCDNIGKSSANKVKVRNPKTRNRFNTKARRQWTRGNLSLRSTDTIKMA